MNRPKHRRFSYVAPLPWPGALSAVVLGAVWLGVAGCRPEAAPGGRSKAEQRFEGPPRTVRAAVVERVPMERVVGAVGSLAALEQSTLSVKVPGRLESIAVDLGSPVKRGQVVAQIERQDYELKLKQAEALLAQARARLGLPLESGDAERVIAENTSTVREARAILDEAANNLERVRKLFERMISSASDLETAQAAHEVAANKYQAALEEVRDRIAQLAQRRAEVEIARQQLNDSAIRAPFDGVVQERRVYVGEYLTVGAPVAIVMRTDVLRLRLEVPERDAPGIRAGLEVRLAVEGETNAHSGKIARLSPAITEQSRMLIVEADVRNPGTLRPGAFARAEIVVEAGQPVVAVPAAALVSFAGLEKVFTVKDGRAVERNVASGRRSGGMVELVRGEVSAGDVVVLAPGSLQNGQPVVVSAATGLTDTPPPGREQPARKPGGS
jgi:RND family efflux transporter MFP subunit